MSGKLKIFFKPRVSELGACQWENVSDAMDAAKYYAASVLMCCVCVDGKFVQMNKLIIFFVMYNKTVTYTKYYIIV